MIDLQLGAQIYVYLSRFGEEDGAQLRAGRNGGDLWRGRERDLRL